MTSWAGLNVQSVILYVCGFTNFDYFREKFGVHHPTYADALLDYGFYLLNVDSITAAVKVYQVGYSLGLRLWCLMPRSTIFQLYRFIGGGKRCT